MQVFFQEGAPLVGPLVTPKLSRIRGKAAKGLETLENHRQPEPLGQS